MPGSAADDLSVGDAVRLAGVRFGWPGNCPSCGRPGYLEAIDLRSRTSRSVCRTCGEVWHFVEGPDGSAVLDPEHHS